MRSVRLAELVIRLFTSRDRAAALMGDLVETRPRRGQIWFWYSVGRVILSLGWRLFGGVGMSYFMGLCWLDILERPSSIYAPHLVPRAWGGAFTAIAGIGTLLWFIAPYAFFRFGFRDRLAAVACFFAWTISLGVYFWWIPELLVFCSCAFAAGSIWALTSLEWRRAFVALVCATVGSLVAALGVMYLEGIWQMRVYPNAAGINSPVTGLFVGAFVLSIGAICSIAHRFFLTESREVEPN